MASQEQTVEQLFGAALDHRPEDRCAFLDRVCAGEPELRQRVEELLLADEQAGSFLERKTNGGRANASVFGSVNAGRFEPGQIIANRFAVIRFIARGGMGEVYEVEDRFLQGVHVALKVILPHIAGDAGSAHRFEQEVLLARKVTHPNLCPIYDISHCEEPPPPFLFLTMKLLTGETLASRLQRLPPLSRTQIVSIFHQMVVGLTAIHKAGVIHRDIKPNNVMLDQSGPDLCLSIMDFGLARLYASQTTVLTLGLIAGTPGYIAPELLRGNHPSQATDIFALGALFQQVLTGPRIEADGLSAKPTPALGGADVPSVFIHCVKEFLSEDPTRRCSAFEKIQSAFDSGGSPTALSPGTLVNGSPRHVLTRRNFAITSALTACATLGGVAWKWDSVNNRINDLIHPLPLKRFVALLNWPPTSDTHIKPMVAGVIDAIASQLARAEAFDRDLLIIPPGISDAPTSIKQFDALRETLGANLVLAASGVANDKDLHLSLSVFDPSSGRPLREREITWPLGERVSLPDKAVREAAQLLDVNRNRRRKGAAILDTQSSDAYAAFQTAEAYVKQDNDTGLDAAIGKYKEAVELDPRYATAHAKLALAYFRLYVLHGDSSALLLAHSNCELALTLNPNLVAGHLALSSVLEQTGDNDGAAREIAKALAIDPDDPRTLVYQGQLFTRLNRWDDAEATFNRLLKTRPNYWLGHDELGVLYNAEGKYPQAVTQFRTASLAAPKNALALNNLGAVYLQQGKVAEAKKSLERSLDLNLNDSAANTMAAALRSEGKPADAIAFGTKAVELNPAEAGNWLELADCYSLTRGHRAEALEAYTQAVRVQEEELRNDPVNGPGWMLLALCRIKAGSPQSALPLFEKAELGPAGDLDSQLHKARALELLDRRDEALAIVNACLKRGATEFQILTMPDMRGLRDDRRYQEIVKSMPSATETIL